RGAPLVGVALDVGHGLTVNAVGVAEEFVVQPAVQGMDPVRAPEVEGVDVTGLGEPDLALDAMLRQGIPPLPEMLGADIEVLHPVHEEHARAYLRRVLDVVALGPQGRPVTAARGSVDKLAIHGRTAPV